jgi:hypothetical protein
MIRRKVPIYKRILKKLGATRDAFNNFDLVAQGKRGIGKHNGPPWYDGLVYETIPWRRRFPGEVPGSNPGKKGSTGILTGSLLRRQVILYGLCQYLHGINGA